MEKDGLQKRSLAEPMGSDDGQEACSWKRNAGNSGERATSSWCRGLSALLLDLRSVWSQGKPVSRPVSLN